MPVTGEARGAVVVTGAAGGIGAAVAAAFAARSAPIALLDHDPAVHAVRARLAAEYPDAESHSAIVDVTDRDAVDGAFDEAIATLGPPSVVVHAAGVIQTGPVAELTARQWDRVFGVNATGTVNVTRRAADDLVTAGGGALVVITSNAASTPRAGMAAYCASKAAAAAFSRSLGLEVAQHGVRVNLVSPGSTDTPMLRGMHAGDTGGDELTAAARERLLAGEPERFRLGIPLQRVAHAADVAEAVLFLASDAACHITLHDLRIDGGATLDM
ncbi:SDR family oxidoreductase [Nocardia callitridis]|uniref:2,3-dihydro-2,3-dihydroxybenzoate dehydrogenase n=1 Tax=Nocardia callitridis TaxID=648753 RepID=A0ABP9KGB9_9NOCA